MSKITNLQKTVAKLKDAVAEQARAIEELQEFSLISHPLKYLIQHPAEQDKCKRCGGRRKIEKYYYEEDVRFGTIRKAEEVPCPRCKGTGLEPKGFNPLDLLPIKTESTDKYEKKVYHCICGAKMLNKKLEYGWVALCEDWEEDGFHTSYSGVFFDTKEALIAELEKLPKGKVKK